MTERKAAPPSPRSFGLQSYHEKSLPGMQTTCANQVKSQHQSFFFSRFPLEIRNLIYHYAYADHCIYVRHHFPSRNHLERTVPRAGTHPTPDPFDYHHASPSIDILFSSPLLCCWRMHSEVLGVIYAGNTLIFRDLGALGRFSFQISQVALRAIHEVYVFAMGLTCEFDAYEQHGKYDVSTLLLQLPNFPIQVVSFYLSHMRAGTMLCQHLQVV